MESEALKETGKVQYFFRDLQERKHQLETLADRYPGIKATSSLSMNIEINAANASKGPALAALCRHLGFTAANAMAFGDNTNDLDMIQTAGWGIAMKTAMKRCCQLPVSLRNMITMPAASAG